MAKKARRRNRSRGKQQTQAAAKVVYTTEEKQTSLQAWLDERHKTPEGWVEPEDVTGYSPSPFEPYPTELEVIGMAMPDVWTEALVRQWLADAFHTIGMMKTGRIKPAPPGSGMLEVVQAAQDAYGAEDAKINAVPNVAQITRAEFVYPDWILAIPIIRQRKVVVMRARGHKYRHIGKRLKMSHVFAQKCERLAVKSIMKHLNRVQETT